MRGRDLQVGTFNVKHQSVKPQFSQRSVEGRSRSFAVMGGLAALLSLAATGCQMDIAGQTLPSPYYLTDDVQYYAPGPEFKLAREAAALEEQAALQISEPQP